jgi:hypothetical protein
MQHDAMNFSSPQKITLNAYPLRAEACFGLFQEAGAKVACIFGGCVRDADCAAFYNTPLAIKDYDARIWVPHLHHHHNIDCIMNYITKHTNSTIVNLPSYDTDTPRFGITLDDTEIDLSFRLKPAASFSDPELSQKLAQDRACRSDVGLSAVALDNTMQAWALPEYLSDRDNKTITVFNNGHDIYSLPYAKKLMTQKYPQHRLIVL